MKTMMAKTSLLVAVLLAGAHLTACGGDDSSSSPGGSTAGLHINEVMPANASRCADEKGQFDDWIELYNSSDKDIELTGLSVTDDSKIPFKHVMEAGLVVPAKGYLLLWADDDLTQGKNHLPFKLGASGEQLLIYGQDGKTVIDQVEWTNALADESFARLPDGTGDFSPCGSPTCDGPNGSSCTAVADGGGQ